MPDRLDLNVYSGDDYTLELTVRDADGDLVDLSDRTWTAQWRRTPSSDSPVAFTVDDTDAATGVLLVSLTATQTAALTKGVWDLQGTYTADSSKETLLHGTVNWNMDVTR